MRRLWRLLFADKPYGCGFCGKTFRTEKPLSKHFWKHEGF